MYTVPNQPMFNRLPSFNRKSIYYVFFDFWLSLLFFILVHKLTHTVYQRTDTVIAGRIVKLHRLTIRIGLLYSMYIFFLNSSRKPWKAPYTSARLYCLMQVSCVGLSYTFLKIHINMTVSEWYSIIHACLVDINNSMFGVFLNY